jgi:hypothetical protein
MNDSDRKLLTEAIGLKWFDYPEGNVTFGGLMLHNLEFNSESEMKVLLDKGPEQKWWGAFSTTLPKDGSMEDLFRHNKFPKMIVKFLNNGKRTLHSRMI